VIEVTSDRAMTHLDDVDDLDDLDDLGA